MAEGSDYFYADSAINWEKYKASAEELRRSKRDDSEEGGSTAFLRSIPRRFESSDRVRIGGVDVGGRFALAA